MEYRNTFEPMSILQKLMMTMMKTSICTVNCNLLQVDMHRIGSRGNPTTSVKRQVHFDHQTIELDGLHAASWNSALQIVAFDGRHSQSLNWTVCTLYPIDAVGTPKRQAADHHQHHQHHNQQQRQQQQQHHNFPVGTPKNCIGRSALQFYMT